MLALGAEAHALGEAVLGASVDCHGRPLQAARDEGDPDYSAGTGATRLYFAAAMSNQL